MHLGIGMPEYGLHQLAITARFEFHDLVMAITQKRISCMFIRPRHYLNALRQTLVVEQQVIAMVWAGADPKALRPLDNQVLCFLLTAYFVDRHGKFFPSQGEVGQCFAAILRIAQYARTSLRV